MFTEAIRIMKSLRNYLIFLLAFLGLGALAGGVVLILAPNGDLIDMPVNILEKSPFTNFFIPGLILFLILGLFPLFLIMALIKKYNSSFAEKFNCFTDMHWSWSFSLYIGFALIIWIQIQMQFIQMVHLFHIIYTFLGIAIIFTALLPQVRKLYIK